MTCSDNVTTLSDFLLIQETKPEFRAPCEALQYLEKVYVGSRGVLDALTWHHYYMDGRTATIKDFVDPK